MPRPSIEYLNARRELRKGSDHSAKRAVTYCRDRDLDLWERTDLMLESAWADYRIRAEAMWQQIFERFGILPADPIDEIPF